jgi:hypothetical protein
MCEVFEYPTRIKDIRYLKGTRRGQITVKLKKSTLTGFFVLLCLKT